MIDFNDEKICDRAMLIYFPRGISPSYFGSGNSAHGMLFIYHVIKKLVEDIENASS